MTISPREVVGRWKAAWANGDKATIRQLTAEDFEWVVPPSSVFIENPEDPVIRGRDRFLDLTERGGGNVYRVETMKINVRREFEVGDTFIEEWSMRVTAHNGRPYYNNYCNVWTINEKGQICRSAEYLDTAAWQATIVPGLLRNW